MTAAKKQPKRLANKAAAKKTSAKKTSEKETAAKKTSAKKPLRKKPSTDQIAVDGTRLSDILDLAGAAPPADSRPLATLEQQLGRPVPGELRAYLARALELDQPGLRHPSIADGSFAGALPDVPAWLAQLQKPFEGPRQAIHQLLALYPIGMKLDHGDYLQVFAGLDRYCELDTGGAFYFDDAELSGASSGTLSGFLLRELHAHRGALQTNEGGQPRDGFHFDRPDPTRAPPEAAELPATAAFKVRVRALTARYQRIVTLLQLLRGKPPHLAGVPTEELWLTEQASLATDHANAMYWLLAHWLFDNKPELADAITRTAAHPSPLVAALREHVASHDTAAYAAHQEALFAAVRRATP